MRIKTLINLVYYITEVGNLQAYKCNKLSAIRFLTCYYYSKNCPKRIAYKTEICLLRKICSPSAALMVFIFKISCMKRNLSEAETEGKSTGLYSVRSTKRYGNVPKLI